MEERDYDWVPVQDLHAIAMELADETLIDFVLRSHREASRGYTESVEEKVVAPLVKQLCEAFKFLHGMGIVHRDFKLENALYNREEKAVKLIDWGNAYKHEAYVEAEGDNKN